VAFSVLGNYYTTRKKKREEKETEEEEKQDLESGSEGLELGNPSGECHFLFPTLKKGTGSKV
jgi:hypothetical protein